MRVKCQECGSFFECTPGQYCDNFSTCIEGVCYKCECEKDLIANCQQIDRETKGGGTMTEKCEDCKHYVPPDGCYNRKKSLDLKCFELKEEQV